MAAKTDPTSAPFVRSHPIQRPNVFYDMILAVIREPIQHCEQHTSPLSQMSAKQWSGCTITATGGGRLDQIFTSAVETLVVINQLAT